jgi:hypothetical protein
MTGTTLNVNTTALSSTFLPLAGGVMSGAISQPVAPVAANDLANKAYVDASVAPDATSLIKGKVQLAGDLSGTAAAPSVANLAITNAKLANLSGTSQLKGSSSTSSAATNIILGAGLSMTGTTLSATANVLNVVSSTTVYTILGTIPNSSPISLTDYTVNVNPGQSVKINYSWNFQSAGGGSAYAPSFGWSGTSVTDLFQAHIPYIFNATFPYCTTIFQSTPPTQYTLTATNADSVLTQTFTLTAAGLYGPAIAIYAIVYYKNNGSSPVSLTPLFNRDLKSAGGITIQISGGWMDYTYF